MPFHLPFRNPYYNYPFYQNSIAKSPRQNNPIISSVSKSKFNQSNSPTRSQPNKQENNSNTKTNKKEEHFLEILGLKLYFDDVLIICILYCLFVEGVKDDELFLCLILLLFA